MYKQTSIIGATVLVVAIMTIGILGMTYFTYDAYAAGGGHGGHGGTGGHPDGSTNTASNIVIVSGYVHRHVDIGQSITQLNECDSGSTCSNTGSNSVTIR